MTKMLKIAGNLQGFKDDPDYLQREMDWLRTRVRRIAQERKARDAHDEEEYEPDRLVRPGRVGSRDARLQAVELLERERALRNKIDARLDLNRTQRGAPTLGLDVVATEASLGAEERLILLTALPYGIAQNVAESVLGEFSRHWGAISVADAIGVLDPKNISDWLRFRRMFRPSAPLVEHGLIEVGKADGSVGPDTLMCSDIRLTLDAFSKIVGDPDALTEAD